MAWGIPPIILVAQAPLTIPAIAAKKEPAMLTLLAHWISAALGFLVASYLVPGFEITSIPAALFAALVVGTLNILVWPILVVLTLPITLVTFGLFLFVVNAIVLKFGAFLTPGFEIEGFLPAIFGSLALTLIGWLVRFVFGSESRPKRA
jgi:putative membrane protein